MDFFKKSFYFFCCEYYLFYNLFQVNNHNVNWREFISHWPLWSIYIAHFSMNWSNYIIMHWLPTYLTRSLGADKTHIMLTAVPYIMNSLVGVGKYFLTRRSKISPWPVISDIESDGHLSLTADLEVMRD